MSTSGICCRLLSCASVCLAISLNAVASADPGPGAIPYKGVLYANDYSYLNDPSYNAFTLGDSFKLLPVAGGEWGTVDFGGQIRERFHHERGMGRVPTADVPRFEDTDTNFVLTRLRLFTDWKICDGIRFYCEAIYADATKDDGNYAPRPFDRNWGDLLDLFVDVKLTDCFTARIGRQELLFGAQRLVSPLDWSNTRRTFSGLDVIYQNDNWRIDSFATCRVPVVPQDFDQPDDDQKFFGCYSVYSGFENFTVDTYYLGYDNNQPFNPDFPTSADFLLHTMGMRINGGLGSWLWEFEGGPQWGRYGGTGTNHSAGFATGGLGYRTAKSPWQPVIWLYCDYASGNVPGGDFNNFNQLFPLAHKYFGFIDAVQRSNIIAPNILLTASPSPNWQLLMWLYHFESDSEAPVPSNLNTPPQDTSKKLGDELDVLLTYNFGIRSNIAFGWSHFWRGNKILAPADADFLYSQWTVDF